MNSIAVKGLSKSFKEKKVLNEIELSVSEGELFGLLGPSGAGKTTLIKILTGQMSYTGEASLLGHICSQLGNEVYSQVGMVLDNCGLYGRLNCLDNMKIFAKIYKIKEKQCEVLLERMGLLEAAKTPAGKLSKGMQQRLLLGRAVLHQPKLLFLDEPTSGLDPKTAQEIHGFLNELKAAGTTIFLTTHNMEEAYQMCDHLALLNEGNIVAYGKPDVLCRQYNEQNCITVLLKDGSQINLPNQAASAEPIAEYLRQEMVEAIHSSEPNLETVFMKLTGRRLEV